MSNIHPSVTQNRSQVFNHLINFKGDRVFQTKEDTTKKVLYKKINFMVSKPKKDKLYLLSDIFNKGETIRNLEIKGDIFNTNPENSYVFVLKVGKEIYSELTLPFNNLGSFKASRINFTNTGSLALLVKNDSTDSCKLSCSYEYI